nr:uncharacterized protein LOC101884057 [Danio rerio]|eukprot:XP_009301978.1 uncharacterized protein LOC101884057 [Danio rerio]
MWQWYSLHKTLQADLQAGSAQEKKMAQEAFCSVRQWLTMKEEDISVKTLKRFRQYILNKEKPLEDRPLPAAAASSSSSGSRGDGGWADDALLVEALSAFEAQAVEDKGGLPKKPLSFPERQGAGETKRRKRSCEDLSQKPHSDSPLSAAPASTSLLEAPASASLVPGQSSSSAPASASSVPGQSSSSAPASASSFPASASLSAPVSASSVPALASSSAAPTSASSVPASASSSAPASASVSASDVQPRRSSGGSTHSDPAHSEVLFEGWHKMWESGLHGLPSADILWLKEDAERGLFQRAMSYKDKHGNRKWRKVLKDDRMWFHPPEFPGVVEGKVPSADSFFHSSVFFWRPVGVWRYSLRCPRSDCPARTNQKAFLYRCGYSSTVRQICHMSGWYSMLTEVLACNACRKAAKESEEHTIGRFLSWDQCILNQLSPAHRAVFPAVLTLR